MTLRDRMLAGLTGVLLLGAGARLAGSTEPPRVVWPELPRLEAPGEAPAATSRASLRQALAGNVFSASRTPPSTRFRPGAELETTTLAAESLPDLPPPPPAPPQYRVAGTMVVGPEASFALIDANPASPAPEVYRLGDAVGGYRLERVAYDHVVLVGAAGEVRLPITRGAARTRVARAEGPFPNAAPTPPVPLHKRARSSADTPPGAIPAGW